MQIFGALFIIAYGITFYNSDSFGQGCLMIFVGFPALVVTGIYLLVQFIRGRLGSGEETEAKPPARVAEEAARQGLRKELGKAKKQSDANTAALLQYIHDAMRDGWEEEAVRTGLLAKGWTEGQVRGAFGAYKDMLARFPLPQKGLAA